jgi:hypothetical protein
MMHSFVLVEAINSVSMSHAATCDCDICKAARGDVDAYARVLHEVDEVDRQRNAEAAA